MDKITTQGRGNIEEDSDNELKKIRPYGDTYNDGKIQMSFTLPIEDGAKAIEAAKRLMKKMGIKEPSIVFHKKLNNHFTFFNAYGSFLETIDYTAIEVESLEMKTMTMEEIDKYIEDHIERKIVVVGASTGTDAHTVGIDSIINMKGCSGHYGLERYEMIDAHNLGSQVPNKELIKKAVEINADVLLISQTVTQKDIHIKNLSDLIELLELSGLRERFILICGGARITHDLAKELGYDAGFGPNSYAEDVATFIVKKIAEKLNKI